VGILKSSLTALGGSTEHLHCPFRTH